MAWVTKITPIIVFIIGLIHAGLAIGEIFFAVPFLVSRFDFAQEVAIQAKPIVQNAGLYNGFIAAGLFWSVLKLRTDKSLAIFFLICVLIAGVFGAITLRPTTLILQTLPALIALIIISLYKPESKI
jgi:putative membrane protein